LEVLSKAESEHDAEVEGREVVSEISRRLERNRPRDEAGRWCSDRGL